MQFEADLFLCRYAIADLNENLDFFNLLTYDYHSSQEPAVNHHSPLYRYGSVYTHHRSYRSTITHHSTGMEVSALIIGASGQPSLITLQVWKYLLQVWKCTVLSLITVGT
ncbi:MAG: glycosyl hydrolase family 18 protein, partial [bacterium]